MSSMKPQGITHQDVARTRMFNHISQAVGLADAFDQGQALSEALCAGLDTVGAGAPRHEPFGNTRSDAAWWADTATPIELELYAAAALKRIDRTTFAERAKKRLFVSLWESLSNDERAAFLAKADPNGKFQGT